MIKRAILKLISVPRDINEMNILVPNQNRKDKLLNSIFQHKEFDKLNDKKTIKKIVPLLNINKNYLLKDKQNIFVQYNQESKLYEINVEQFRKINNKINVLLLIVFIITIKCILIQENFIYHK